MNLQQLRTDRGWSQEQLAELSGVSARTIQRIENGSNAGLDTLNSLAAAFQTDIAALTSAPRAVEGATHPLRDDFQQLRASRQNRRRREFFLHLATFGLIIPFLVALNLTLSPSYYWVIWPILGWGAAVILHWITVFRMPGFLDQEWEEHELSQRLNGSDRK